MKRVKGSIDVRALGCYDFEFYVPDDASEEEIKQKVEDTCDYYIDYDVEEGYEETTEAVYKKKER